MVIPPSTPVLIPQDGRGTAAEQGAAPPAQKERHCLAQHRPQTRAIPLADSERLGGRVGSRSLSGLISANVHASCSEAV
jgi:hypothetical protein